jgi:hypothetical protein
MLGRFGFSALLLALFMVAADPVAASCLRVRGPRLLQAEVMRCEAPGPLAKQRAEKWKDRGDFLRSLDDMLAAQPARIVSLWVVQYRQLSEDPGDRKTPEAPWVKVDAPKEEPYLLLGAGECSDLAPGARLFFLEEFTCCDVFPPAELSCLVGLQPLVIAPEDLVASGPRPR